MRNRQIDALRTWGILLVIAGHTGSSFSPYIYTFHMPLFFFISGFLRHQRKTENGKLVKIYRKKDKGYPCALFDFLVYQYGYIPATVDLERNAPTGFGNDKF